MLTAIMGSTSVALLALPESNPARSHLENVMLASSRAAHLTKQLLAYAGKGMFEITRIDLSAHVRELVTVLETALPKKVQVRLELAAELPAIEADAGQVQQIVMNLVINGADAIGDERGTVLVTTGSHDIDDIYAQSLFAAEALSAGRYVYLEVHDTGCGMDEATKAKIFDPFFTTKFHGRGLGLAATLGIVRSHRGAIKVYSSPGRGSTFKVFFPAVAGSATRPLAVGPHFRGKGLVLVVDDDEGVRAAVSSLLRYFGFSVIEAFDGRHGVQAFIEHQSECVLVLLDMTMPELGGEEVFREIRRIRSDVPVILTSGYNEIEATRRFTSKGLAGFLQKPFTPAELAQRLRAALVKEESQPAAAADDKE
jgi:CheY-like chemotaxis protein